MNININFEKEFEHLIIIRFSTIFRDRFEFKNYEKTIFNEHKLNMRFDLFQKFCLWSLINQTYINYKVIIIYDENLPKKFFQRLFDLTNNYSFIFLHKWNKNHFLHKNNWLEPYIDFSKKYLITSRFDDDDIFNLNNNERMINKIKETNISDLINVVITFSKGKFIYMENGIYNISNCEYKTPGLWLSYITYINHQYNIFSMDHTKINKKLISLNFPNNFGIVNHCYGNNKRLIRMKKNYKNSLKRIKLGDIYELFKF